MQLCELFSRSYNILKNNLILMQPILLFMLVTVMISPNNEQINVHSASFIMYILSLSALACAFIAGWYSMFNKCIAVSENQGFSSDEERARFSINLFREFFPGVGKYFLNVTIGTILYSIVFLTLSFLIFKVAHHFIGDITSINLNDYLSVQGSQDKALALYNKINNADKIRITIWYMIYIFFGNIFSYLTMFWIPALINKNLTPVMAFIESFKTIFKKPIETFIIYLTYSIGSAFIIIIASITGQNAITEFLALTGIILLFVYYVIMTFEYFVKEKNDNSVSRTNC